MAALALAFDILAKDKASDDINKVGDSLDRTADKSRNFSRLAGAAFVAVGAAAFKFGADSVRAFIEAEEQSAKLDDALARFPRTNDKTRESFDRLNESLAKKTRFDDDATASGQAVLAQFKLTGKQIQDVTPLLQDYAAKTGKDLPAAAEVLGKAFQGKGKALSEVGIKFKDTGDEGKNFDQVMSGLRTQVGGFAENEGTTTAGKLEILKNRFGEVQEKVGSALVPALSTLVGALTGDGSVGGALTGVTAKITDTLGPAFDGLKTFFTDTLLPALATVGRALIEGLGGAFDAVKGAIERNKEPLAALGAAIGVMIRIVTPIISTLASAVIPLIATAFTRIIDVIGLVIRAATGITRVIAEVVDKSLGILEGMFRTLGKLPGKLGDPFDKAAELIGKARGKVQDFQKSIDNLTGKTITITTIFEEQRLASTAAGSTDTKTGIKARAMGGPVRAGQPYIVGEREAELFIPRVSGQILNQKQIAGLGRSIPQQPAAPTYNFTVNTTGDFDPQAMAQVLRRTELLYG